jgi:SAM-dependent methyltransferase
VSTHSARWRARFGDPGAARTADDLRYLEDALPLPGFRQVLDVGCGNGRHKRALESRGYEVVGVDSDPSVAPDVVADMRHLDRLPRDFDAVICWWASFGHFDDEDNARVLAGFAGRLRPGGRVALEVHSRAFFESEAAQARDLGDGVVERSSVSGDRLHVELRHADGERDAFDWRLYGTPELTALGAACGLVPLTVDASPDASMTRVVFGR